MVEFAGVVDALHCSTEIEAAVAITGASLASDRRIEFRIGIRMGASGGPALAVPDSATLLRAWQEFPGLVPNYRCLAACCAQIGRLDEAH